MIPSGPSLTPPFLVKFIMSCYSNPLEGKAEGYYASIKGVKVEGVVIGLVFFRVQKAQIGLDAI